ncbi:MAG: IPT/TIG domain-containing protein [Candidatus Solibacter sp.]
MDFLDKRVALICHFTTFAVLLLAASNPANAAAPDLTFTPTSLNFKYQVGSALPASQALAIKSTGTALNFTISITGPLPYSAQWLSVSANSGTTNATLKVYVNPTGLPSGTYSGTIVVSAAAATTTPQNFPVTLDVGDAPATLTASTGALTFPYTTGGATPNAQPVVLMTSGGALTVSITLSGGTWLKASPGGNIALVGLPGTVNVSVDPTGLTPGSYNGKLTFASGTAVNKNVTVNVTLNITAGVPAIAVNGVWPPGALLNSPATIVTLTGSNFFPTSTAAVGVTPLATSVLSPTTMLATIPANLMATAGNLSVVVSTPTAASSSAPATFVVYGPEPLIWAVTNCASYSASTISPGGIITIYGINLGPANLVTFAGTDPIATSLPATGSKTSVVIDGKLSPLLYTSATQVSAIVPYSVAAKSGGIVQVGVSYGAASSTTFPVSVVDADPGLFTVDASGTGQGAILNLNSAGTDYSVNGTSNPAAKGSIVVIYLTGFGTTTCADIPTTSTCLLGATEKNLIAGNVTPMGAIGVTIDGQTATVLGSAAPIGSVPGVLQVNATVPSTVKAGTAVPVVVVGGWSEESDAGHHEREIGVSETEITGRASVCLRRRHAKCNRTQGDAAEVIARQGSSQAG